MKIRNLPCRRDRSAARRGFTLIELLVVIAIILVIMSMLLPGMRNMRARADQTSCVSMLRQVYVVVLAYASDNKGQLPPGNWRNPMVLVMTNSGDTVNATVSLKLQQYMNENNIGPESFYCPSLTKQDKRYSPANWGRNVAGIGASDEYPMGFFYAGFPSRANYSKYADAQYRDYLLANRGNARSSKITMFADYNHAPDPTPAEGGKVGRWWNFPHNGPTMPAVGNSLLGDGSVNRKRVNDLRMHYHYNPGKSGVYW